MVRNMYDYGIHEDSPFTSFDRGHFVNKAANTNSFDATTRSS